MWFQVCEFLLCCFVVNLILRPIRALALVMIRHKAKRHKLIRSIVMLRVAHDRLLRDADHVAGGDVSSVGEGEIFEDFALDGYCVRYELAKKVHIRGG